jgi:hypothetical protein
VLRVVQHDQPHADVKPALDQAAQQVQQQQQQEEKDVATETEHHIKVRSNKKIDNLCFAQALCQCKHVMSCVQRDGTGDEGVVQQEKVIRVTMDRSDEEAEDDDEDERHAATSVERSPPESIFRKLMPSPQRYSITRRDEL